MRPPTADLSVESTLAHCELLEPLSEAQIEALAEHCRMVTVREGDTLFDQNTVAHSLFVVASGRVIEVVEVGQYSVSGWSSLVAPHVYVAEASALEDSTVLAVSADEVEDILLREPAAGYAVMKQVAGVISTRLRDIKEELIEVLES
jgi:CRP-like cAMP-binding protein